jgi:YVTN family beta-propeller protein
VILLEIMILMSTIIWLHNNSFAQTYDTITKHREMVTHHPQIQLGRGVGASPSQLLLYAGSPRMLLLHLVGWLVGIKLAADPFTNKIYVANSASNTVSVISASSDKEITRIPVGENPSAIQASSVFPSLSYVLDIPINHTDTMSVIDDSVEKVAAGITFNIRPANSGNVWCNNEEYPTNVYLYIVSGTKCIARPAKDFEFSSWIENLPHNSTIPLNESTIYGSPWNSFLSTLGMKPNDPSATFDVNKFGTFTANFKAVPPPVPPQYWIPLYGIIVSTIVGWSIPSIIGWTRARTKRKKTVKEYADIINSLSSASDRNSLDRIKNQVIHAHISEKISEFQYKILNEKI